MLLGLVRASSGSARVPGAAPGDPAALTRIGMLVESPAFYPYVSGRNNPRVFVRHASVPRRQVDEVLEIAGLTGRGTDRRPAIRVIAGRWMTLSVVFGYGFSYLNYLGTPAGPAAGEDLGERVLSEALPVLVHRRDVV
jgi:hypothetical protein